MSLQHYLPITSWLKTYSIELFRRDAIAAFVVAIILIPQSLAYALLAGVPAEVGLYASILPLVVYAIFGSSRTLSVAPVAITSLMTAAALGDIAAQGSGDYLSAAVTLAALSGLFLAALGLLRLGFLANFLSEPVVSGFITASGLIIGLSQLKHLLGISADGDTILSLLPALVVDAANTNLYTLSIGGSCLIVLFWLRHSGTALFLKLGIYRNAAPLLTKAVPIVIVFATIGACYSLGLAAKGTAIVGAIPSGLPQLSLPNFSPALVKALLMPAALISIIGYVGSISVGRTLAAKRKQQLDPNQELLGLGMANLASAWSGGIPVTGGFARSVVNFDAGAATQVAGIFTALLIALATLVLTPALYYLPKATLAAIIIVSVLPLIDISIFKRTWRYDKSDCFAVAITVFATLLFGIEAGVSCGVASSIGLHLYRTSRPHIAEVGLVEGTEHFRNIHRFHVATEPEILAIRVDESLFFGNANYLEETIYQRVFNDDHIAHVILMCSAVNEIDFSALEAIRKINQRLYAQGVMLHLSEVKGPVFDALGRSGFLQELSGKVFISQYNAFRAIQKMLNA